MHMWQTIRTASVDRHTHARPYVAVVVSGGYEEAGDLGRFRVRTGDVIFHESFEAHLNRIDPGDTVVLNLNLDEDCNTIQGLAHIADVDAFVRIAEKDQRDALSFLMTSATLSKTTNALDWEDELCRAMLQDASMLISVWAEQNGLSPSTVSRGFRKVFEVTPESYRARARARHAWRLIRSSKDSLINIALQVGFADQAHMSRGIKQLTGMTPTDCRPEMHTRQLTS